MPVSRKDFDAAFVSGFRAQTVAAYRDLDRAWDESSSSVLDADGEFRDGAALSRDCPCCGARADQARPSLRKLGMRIVTCADCGTTYSRDVLNAELDRRLYLSSAAQASYRALKKNDSYASLERLKARYLIQELSKHAAPPGCLLDIGAGSGRLLEAATAAGWTASGVEANPEFADACRNSGLSVTEGFFPDCPGLLPRYEAVALLDVLEHALDPAALLRGVRDRLAPRGVALVQVPNYDSLLVRAQGASSTNFCHGHWNHFNAATLAGICGRAGFAVLHLETIISELDRIRNLPPDKVRATAQMLAGAPAPERIDEEWLHANRLGYKLVGYFRREEP